MLVTDRSSHVTAMAVSYPATSGIYPGRVRQPQLALHVLHIRIIETRAIPGTSYLRLCGRRPHGKVKAGVVLG